MEGRNGNLSTPGKHFVHGYIWVNSPLSLSPSLLLCSFQAVLNWLVLGLKLAWKLYARIWKSLLYSKCGDYALQGSKGVKGGSGQDPQAARRIGGGEISFMSSSAMPVPVPVFKVPGATAFLISFCIHFIGLLEEQTTYGFLSSLSSCCVEMATAGRLRHLQSSKTETLWCTESSFPTDDCDKSKMNIICKIASLHCKTGKDRGTSTTQ